MSDDNFNRQNEAVKKKKEDKKQQNSDNSIPFAVSILTLRSNFKQKLKESMVLDKVVYNDVF